MKLTQDNITQGGGDHQVFSTNNLEMLIAHSVDYLLQNSNAQVYKVDVVSRIDGCEFLFRVVGKELESLANRVKGANSQGARIKRLESTSLAHGPQQPGKIS